MGSQNGPRAITRTTLDTSLAKAGNMTTPHMLGTKIGSTKAIQLKAIQTKVLSPTWAQPKTLTKTARSQAPLAT